MGRKEKPKSKAMEERGDDHFTGASPSLVFSSDDDEANQDLSLKIVEKAMRMRAAKHAAPSDDVLSSQTLELAVVRNVSVSDVPSAIADSEVKEKKKITKLKIEIGDESVVIANEQEMEQTIKDNENHESVEGGAVQTGDNMVLRKLLRGPRYFDPPNNSWGACFNCGEEGHAAVNCSVAKRKKPCYVCGVLGHNAKQCTKTKDCFICKKGGHRARDCPEKHASTPGTIAICLKCGNSGHDMFGCKNDYSLDDLQEIQCYVCKKLGHLCCVNSDDATPGEISCYKCGRLGHTGLACSRLQDEIASGATPSSCFKCGEEGHFARECTSAVKTVKRSRDSSRTKDKRSHKENDYIGNRSAPNDMDVARRKKRSPTEERGGFSLPKKSKSRGGWMQEHPDEERGFTTPKKSKSRGGWTTEHPAEHKGYTTPKKSRSRGDWSTEHPEEFFPPMAMRNSYRFSGSPYSRSTTIHSFGSGSHTPGYKSSKVWTGHDGTPMSQGSAWSNHHRFSASRFGNSSSGGYGRNYSRW
ncbi:zinc finger CCHC domain-containing protein 7-like [Vigna unguiculata]|uniref:Cellular nucleic acid-binding protein n=1 Tax=Vigna unguiculata TaxID=3917 RepID=A0A4D6KNQ5_VIGUN|nr:zinc finger CCHC domain-containing protein 7-like [Vigna unguiculata]QCD79182.1 cellular nucleic acid-binding protein [Vigna unguiculata]